MDKKTDKNENMAKLDTGTKEPGKAKKPEKPKEMPYRHITKRM